MPPPRMTYFCVFMTALPVSLDINIALLGEACKQLVHGLGEEPHTFFLQLLRDGAEIETQVLQPLEIGASLIDAFQKGGAADAAVLPEGVQGGNRHRVHGVGPNQLLDIEHIRISRILGAGAAPQDALRAGAARPQVPEPLAVKDFPEPLVNEFGISD